MMVAEPRALQPEKSHENRRKKIPPSSPSMLIADSRFLNLQLVIYRENPGDAIGANVGLVLVRL